MKMPFKAVVSTFLLLGMTVAPAFAGDHGRGGRDRDYDRGRHSQDYDRQDRGYSRNRGHDRGYDRRVVYRPVHVQPRPVYVDHRPVHVHQPAPWRRGGYYHGSGYGPTYVVHDYGHYGLRRPPHGHVWRRSDIGDFILVAVATGIIADVILSR